MFFFLTCPRLTSSSSSTQGVKSWRTTILDSGPSPFSFSIPTRTRVSIEAEPVMRPIDGALVPIRESSCRAAKDGEEDMCDICCIKDCGESSVSQLQNLTEQFSISTRGHISKENTSRWLLTSFWDALPSWAVQSYSNGWNCWNEANGKFLPKRCVTQYVSQNRGGLLRFISSQKWVRPHPI